MRRLAAIGLAAVLGGAVGAVSLGTAHASTVPLEVDFGILLPGQSATAETEVVVPVHSVVTAAAWDDLDGAGVWGARLCAEDACTSLDRLEGAELPAGDYRLVVDVALPDDAPAAATAARGSIALMEAIELPLTDGGLALTGGAMPWPAALVGATALGGGAAIVLRRRARGEESPA